MQIYNLTEVLVAIGLSPSVAGTWGHDLQKLMDEAGIDTRNRIACFVSNILTETASFRSLSENLNYSAEGLARTWRRFSDGKGNPNALALSIARNPEAIANHAYAGRMGNGDVLSGDGWKYRGRGAIMVTGKDNYINFQKFLRTLNIQDDVVNHPELLTTPRFAILSAIWYWEQAKCNIYADKGDLDGVRDLINIGRKTLKVGDAHGYNATKVFYDKIRTQLTYRGIR